MIRASAPGRCGLVGNPTDGYGGSVISTSLAERAVVEIAPADETVLEICGYRERISRPEDLAFNQSYADVAKAVLRMFEGSLQDCRFHLRAETNIPIQAGLAGSTTMVIAILGGVLRMLEIQLNPWEIAETARHIEFRILNCVCGFQDQYMAVFGGLNYMDFRGKEPHNQMDQGDPVFATVENLAPFVGEPPLLLAGTGVQRHSGTVHKGFRQRWLEGDPDVVDGYRRAAELAREAKRSLLEGDWADVGRAMNENHAIQRDLGGSGEANEKLIRAALDAGALGAKLAGAGRGGTIVALHEDPDDLGRKLLSAGAARVLRVLPSEGLVVEGQI